ncbi:MAG: peroxiredoxin [Actinomycetota bacterium]
MSITIGESAPEFSLSGTGGKAYSLAQFRGAPVVLVFYPGDNTPVCTKQLCKYNDELSQFTGLSAQVLGISTQSVESHEKFAARHGFKFPLLADIDKSVHRAYGVLGLMDMPRRSVFVIDGAGVVRYAHRALVGVTYRPVDELVGAINAAR